MNYYFYLIIVLQASKLYDITQAQKRDGRGKAKYNRNAARQKIVRCCGAQSCTQFNAIYKATTSIINGSAASASSVTLRVTNDQATDAKTLTDETQFSQISDAPVQQEETTTTIINDLNSAPSPSEPNLPVVPDSTTETTLPTQNEIPASSMIPDPIITMQAVETSSSTFTQLESTANPNLNILQPSSLAPATSQKNVPIPSSTPNVLTTTAKIAAPTTTTTEMTTILFIKPTTATTNAPEVYPKCPTLCKRDASLFDLDKSLRDPSDHGFLENCVWKSFCFWKISGKLAAEL
ncbi:mucin-2-like [Neocloeon triangulifer]|uniref:mucin-2-like n=1 Tax=Neocloeon triangulifer TaxID=2078957 RepID=UPI00286FA2D7|nr:mucin-2-like [Neocloeon triangulifer]